MTDILILGYLLVAAYFAADIGVTCTKDVIKMCREMSAVMPAPAVAGAAAIFAPPVVLLTMIIYGALWPVALVWR